MCMTPISLWSRCMCATACHTYRRTSATRDIQTASNTCMHTHSCSARLSALHYYNALFWHGQCPHASHKHAISLPLSPGLNHWPCYPHRAIPSIHVTPGTMRALPSSSHTRMQSLNSAQGAGRVLHGAFGARPPCTTSCRSSGPAGPGPAAPPERRPSPPRPQPGRPGMPPVILGPDGKPLEVCGATALSRPRPWRGFCRPLHHRLSACARVRKQASG